jgi:hypothetical protein
LAFIAMDIGVNTVDFRERIPMIAAVVLVLQGLAFWIIEDVMCSMRPPPEVLMRFALLASFQLAFLFGFIILLPAWMRWRTLRA